MISIICPVYNNEKFLDDCIHSVLEQSFLEWELILVDDGSTDRSSTICDRYASLDKRIKAYHKNNEGQWLTREFGISKAKGEYFIFLDSDDMLEVDALNTLDQAIKLSHSDVLLYDICKLNLDMSKICLQELHEHKHLNNSKDIINFCFIKNNCISLCVYCFRKDFYLSCGLNYSVDKTMRSQEDFLMLFEILRQLSDLTVIPKILYIYRTNNNSVSSTLNVKDYYRNIFISDSIYKEIFKKFNCDLDTYSEKIIKRLAWQPLSFIKRAYRDLDRKERKPMFAQVKRSFIYKHFTKKYRFESRKDRLLLFLFRINMHSLNRIICHE